MLSSGRLNRFGTSAWSKPMAFHAKVVRVFTRVLESRRSRHPSESRWHRAVAPGVDLGEIATHGLALSRLKHGFESRREGPKEVRSSLRRQSFSGDSKREVIAPALGRTRRGFAPATVGGAHHRPPFPNQEGVEGRLPRHGDRRLGPHSSASPAGQRQKPGCAWLRGMPCSAAFCTLVCCKSARLLETWPTNPLPSTNKYFFNFIGIIGVDYSARRRGCAASTGCGSGVRAARTYGCRRRRFGKSEDAADPEESTRIPRVSHPRQPCSPTRGRPPGEMADAARRAMPARGAGSAVARSSPRGPRRTPARTGWPAASRPSSRRTPRCRWPAGWLRPLRWQPSRARRPG